AAHRVGLDRVDELTLEAALALPAQGAVLIQMSVGPLDDAGRRSVTVHGRAHDAADDAAWTRHASGTLAPVAGEALSFDLRAWPPPGAVPVATEGFYDALLASGVTYGPDFQGLRAVWRRGDELFAEATLPETVAKESGR